MNSANRGSRNGERDSRLYAIVARSRIMSDWPGSRDITSTYIIRSTASSALPVAYRSSRQVSGRRPASRARNSGVYSSARRASLNQKYCRLSA